jgi:hypothetical protein
MRNLFSYCIRKVSLFSVVLLCSCSGNAEIVKYLGCEWVIPPKYSKSSDVGYLRYDDEVYGKINFTHHDPDYHNSLKNDPDVTYLYFETGDVNGLTISSRFVINKSARVGLGNISIINNNSIVSLYGLKREEALTLSQLCVEPEVIVEHYDKLDSWYSEYCGEIGTDKVFCGDR